MHKFDYTVSAQFRTSAWLYSCTLHALEWPRGYHISQRFKRFHGVAIQFEPHQFKIILHKTDHEMGDFIDT